MAPRESAVSEAPAAAPAAAAPAVAIGVEGLRKSFRLGAEELVALEGVSLVIREGEFVSLVGPSGCSKSTVLNVVAGLIAVSGGRVAVKGQPVAGPRRGDYAAKAEELLRLVGLERFLCRYPFELSGGTQQRVAICRMLLCDSVVLLMDEPCSALDEMSREYLNLEHLRIWDEHRKTVIFVTHNIGEAVFLSDPVVVMSARPGRIAAVIDIGLPRPRSRETLLSDAFFGRVTAVRKALDDGGQR